MNNPETMNNFLNNSKMPNKHGYLYSPLFSRFGHFSKNQSLDFESLTDEAIIFLREFFKYLNICLNMFKWKFDESKEQLNGDFLERLLFFKGRAAVIDDPTRGLLVVDYSNKSTKYNILCYPNEITAIDLSDNNKVIGTYRNTDEKKEFVIVENNKTFIPTALDVITYCAEIASLTYAENLNTDGQKTPILFQGNERQKQSIKNLAIQYDLGYPYIFADKELNLDDISKIELQPKFISKEIQDLIYVKRNDLLSAIGINNENINKQSGISPYETNANNDFVTNVFLTKYNCRKEAADKIQKAFNIDCEVMSIESIHNKSKSDYGTIDESGKTTAAPEDSKLSQNSI